jgi:hypothetical protein
MELHFLTERVFEYESLLPCLVVIVPGIVKSVFDDVFVERRQFLHRLSFHTVDFCDDFSAAVKMVLQNSGGGMEVRCNGIHGLLAVRFFHDVVKGDKDVALIDDDVAEVNPRLVIFSGERKVAKIVHVLIGIAHPYTKPVEVVATTVSLIGLPLRFMENEEGVGLEFVPRKSIPDGFEEEGLTNSTTASVSNLLQLPLLLLYAETGDAFGGHPAHALERFTGHRCDN